jgi:hypothetical protein
MFFENLREEVYVADMARAEGINTLRAAAIVVKKSATRRKSSWFQ